MWKKDSVTARISDNMKDMLKQARYKINFILHHLTGSMLTSTAKKWIALKPHILDMCYNTLLLVPRLAESCPHSPTTFVSPLSISKARNFSPPSPAKPGTHCTISPFPLTPAKFIPVLRRCAMLDILDKDWNMLGGWEDILKGMEAKCCTGRAAPRSCASPATPFCTKKRPFCATPAIPCSASSFPSASCATRKTRPRSGGATFPSAPPRPARNIETAGPAAPAPLPKVLVLSLLQSPACQEYCDNIMGLHPKFCKDTPASKAALCQKETEQYLGWTTAAASGDNEDGLCRRATRAGRWKMWSGQQLPKSQ